MRKSLINYRDDLGPEFGTQESLVRIQSPRPAFDRPVVPRRYNGASSRAAARAVSHCSVSKLLLLVIAIVVAYFVLTGLARKRRQRTAPPPVEPMVPCAHCGVNVPRSEALGGDGRFFCSEEHRRVGAG